MNVKHIAIVYPPHAFSTLDVAVGYSRAFERIGMHVTEIRLDEIVRDWEAVSRNWQRDREWIVERTSADVLFGVLETQPDLAVIIDGTRLHDIFWTWMRRLGIPTATVLVDCPYYDDLNSYIAAQSTYAFANDRLSAATMDIPYLPVAYRHDIHKPAIVNSQYHSDVVFVGTGFAERVEILESIDWTGINFKLFGFFRLRNDSPLRPYFMGMITNPEAARYYCGAKVGINLDRISIDIEGTKRISERWSAGPRIYELAACGTPIITQNNIEEIGKLTGGAHIPFDSPDQLENLIRFWIQDNQSDARKELAHNARVAIENEHYINRAIQMLETVQT